MLPQTPDVSNTKDYSTKAITAKLLSEIEAALKNLDYGSVELYVQNGEVTQITKRQIKKTNHVNTLGGN